MPLSYGYYRRKIKQKIEHPTKFHSGGVRPTPELFLTTPGAHGMYHST